jgi:peptide/nickel transport system ATP-binding protein
VTRNSEAPAGRCPVAIARCSEALPPLVEVAPGHAVRCIRIEAVGGVPRAPLALPDAAVPARAAVA